MRPVVGVTADVREGLFVLKPPYIEALVHFGFDPVIVPPAPSPTGLVARLEGIVFTGGADLDPVYYGERIAYGMTLVDRQRSDFEIGLLRDCVAQDLPVLAICYGMQVMNVALGGSLYQDLAGQLPGGIDHGSGTHAVTLDVAGVIGEGRHEVNSSHHQAVKTVGRGLRIVGRSDDGVIEAIDEPSRRFCVGVQWHPERDLASAVNIRLFEQFREACCE